jgi:2-hydroxyacyl-CoA lyase 1
VGKGVAYSNGENEIRSFLEKSNLPFLATPMGKGIVSDFDKRSVGSARTFVLKNADVIFLCGARLNWILHFGTSPRFNKNVKFIQLDSDPLEMHTNVKAEIPLVGDAKTILNQLADATSSPLISNDSAWWKALNEQTHKNKLVAESMMADRAIPMNYYSVLKVVEDAIHKNSKDFILVSEGSNTMDIGRTILSNTEARQRLDAGTFGTMGVGFGFAIAA